MVVAKQSKPLLPPVDVPIIGKTSFSLLSVFFLHLHEFTKVEIGEIFGVDRMRVSRLIDKANNILS